MIEKEPWPLAQARPFLLRHREAFLAQIRAPHPSLKTGFDAIATLDYTPGFEHCVSLASEFLSGL